MMIVAWLVVLVALPGGTVWAYRDTYASAAQQAAAVRLARADTAGTLMYGELPLPGTTAQMFAWEVGGIATVLVAVFAVLLAVAVTRAAEDDGTVELLRGCGVHRHGPLRAAAAVILLVAAVLWAAVTVAVGAWTGRADGVTGSGAVAFGATLGLTLVLVAALTVLLSQLAADAARARWYGLAAVGVSFAWRATADVAGAGAMNWLSPLALRATVQPFTEHRWWLLFGYLSIGLALFAMAEFVAGRREYGAGLLGQPGTRDGRLRVRSATGLQAHLVRTPVLLWAVAVASIAALFTAMGSGVVEQGRTGDVGGFLGAQLGTADPVAAYCRYTATVLAIIVSAYAIVQVLAYRTEETAGRIGLALGAGARRYAPLAAHLVVALGGGAGMLLAAASVGALVAPMTLGGDDTGIRMFVSVVGQWPVIAAMAGAAALLQGILPRMSALAWAPLAAAGTLALLGPLLGVPRWIAQLSPLQQVPDVVAPHPDVGGLVVLALLAGAAAGAAIAGAARRDTLAG